MTIDANNGFSPRSGHRMASAGMGLIIGLGLSTGWSCSNEGQSQTSGGRNRGRDVIAPVAVSVVASQDLARRVTLAGPVEPIRIVEVNSRTAGSINTVRVVEGDRVRSGQRLAELDARETEAQLGRARAVHYNAETAFRRSEQLAASGIVTNAELEQARASYETARSDVTLWETRLDFTRILAPTGGMVTAKYVEAGSAVSTNQRLFDIADDTLLVIRVQMSELDVVHVRRGDTVQIELDAYPGSQFDGTVRRIFPSATAQTRLVPVEVALAPTSGDRAPRVGFLARVHFSIERRRDVLAVPASALGAGASGTFVYLVEADTLIRRFITTGLTSEGMVEVAAGLEGGELVVTSPQLNLQPGAQVRVSGNTETPSEIDSIGSATGLR